MCSENKGADQLRGHREADLHLCFRICKKWFYQDAAQIYDTFYKKKEFLKPNSNTEKHLN